MLICQCYNTGKESDQVSDIASSANRIVSSWSTCDLQYFTRISSEGTQLPNATSLDPIRRAVSGSQTLQVENAEDLITILSQYRQLLQWGHQNLNFLRSSKSSRLFFPADLPRNLAIWLGVYTVFVTKQWNYSRVIVWANYRISEARSCRFGSVSGECVLTRPRDDWWEWRFINEKTALFPEFRCELRLLSLLRLFNPNLVYDTYC